MRGKSLYLNLKCENIKSSGWKLKREKVLSHTTKKVKMSASFISLWKIDELIYIEKYSTYIRIVPQNTRTNVESLLDSNQVQMERAVNITKKLGLVPTADKECG